MNIKNQKDFVSGLMFTAVGIAFATGSTSFQIGGAARMGPGYFPLLLGLVLTALGLLVTAQALRSSAAIEKIDSIAWRPLIFILSANLVFGALLVGLPSIGLPPFGLIVAIYALVIIAGYARSGHRLKESLVLATVLAAGSYGAFVYALNLQFPVLPWFLSR